MSVPKVAFDVISHESGKDWACYGSLEPVDFSSDNICVGIAAEVVICQSLGNLTVILREAPAIVADRNLTS